MRAGSAPAGPEIKQHKFTSEIRKTDGVAAAVLECEVGDMSAALALISNSQRLVHGSAALKKKQEQEKHPG